MALFYDDFFFFGGSFLFYFFHHVLCIVDVDAFFCLVMKDMSLIAFSNLKNAAEATCGVLE